MVCPRAVRVVRLASMTPAIHVKRRPRAPCLENPHRYLLLVRWETLEAHTEGFRGSPEYQRWRALLHHFYEPFPTVEHYQPKFGSFQQ